MADMDMRHWSGVLRLPSLVTVADGRVCEDELRVFAHCLPELRRHAAPDMMFSEGMVRDWFQAHRDEIDEQFATDWPSAMEATLGGLDD